MAKKAASKITPGSLIIDDDYKDNDNLFRFNPEDGVTRGRGYEERDWKEYPQEYLAQPDEMELIPESEWSARIKEQEKEKSRLSDVRMTGWKGKKIPSMDQGQNGYCWGHSTVTASMIDRAVRLQPHVPLSAYHVCAVIKKGRNEGGWCGLSHEFLRKIGVSPQVLWPQGSRDLRLDTPELREAAKPYRVTEDWVDLTKQVYDQNLTFQQVATCLLSGIPVALDFDWWGHSVCGLDLVEVERGSFGIRILNSWSDGWGDEGFGIIRGSKIYPMGAVATRVASIAV